MPKLCKTCGEEKAEAEFHRDRSKADGLNAYCKACHIAKQRVYAARPPRRVDPLGLKTCQVCKVVKPTAEYWAASRTWDGLAKRCKVCEAAHHKAWRRKNLGKVAANQKAYRAANPERFADYLLKQNYGLASGEYERMLEAQGGRCAICGTEDTGKHKRFHVDHCHDTQVIRGLLCGKCNLGIGQLRHDPHLLQSAISYLLAKR